MELKTRFQATRRVQEDFGVEWCGGEHSFLLFEVQLCNLHLVFLRTVLVSQAFINFQDLLVDIHWQPEGSKEAPRLLGSCFLLPDTLKHSLGQIEIPVTSPK